MRARQVTGFALTGLLTGCGSTVQYAGTATVTTGDHQEASGQSGLGAVATTGGGSVTTPGTPRGSITGTTGGTVLGATGGASGTTTGGPAGVPGGGGAAGSGLGFTKTTISIGFATAKDENAFAGSLGIKGVSTTGDPVVQMQAVVDDINNHGGLLGRKIVLVAHDYNTAQTLNDPATANQAACTDWTQDHHVFAVVGAPIVEETLLQCLGAAHTPLVNAGGLDFPYPYDSTFARHPLFFDVAQMSGERHDRIAIERLVARGFFTPWDTLNGKPGAPATTVKLGILGYDDAPGAIQIDSDLKQLKSHGISVSSTDIVRCPRPVSGTISCQQSAVLKFASDGVTHVFGAGIIFIGQAESQHYRPRYFFTVEPRTIAENSPPAQMTGAMGESNIPMMDVEPSDYPGDPSPATAYCEKVMRRAGQAASDPTTVWTQLSMCDGLYALQAAANLGASLGPQQLLAGFERLGTSLPAALTWGSMFGPGLHASSVVLRDVAFDSQSNRFVYVDKINRT